MNRDPETMRPLTGAEKAVLDRALALSRFAGREQLQAQAEHAVVVGGSPFQLDLGVVAEIERSTVSSGPIPTRCLVVDDDGQPSGEIIVWVTDGYLAGLEYAWFSEGVPSSLPSPEGVVSA